MRTTIDLPADLHHMARQIAHEQHRSMSSVLAELVRRGLRADEREATIITRNGLPVLKTHGIITMEDVRRARDEDYDDLEEG